MAQYQDGQLAVLGDLVVGKPNYYPTDVAGVLVEIYVNRDHDDGLVAFMERVDPDSPLQPGILVPFMSFSSLTGRAPLVVRPRLEPVTIQHFKTAAVPQNTIIVGGRSFSVGHRVTGEDLKKLCNQPSTVSVYRRSGGGQDPEIGHDQTVEVRTGMEFYFSPQPK